MRIVVVHNRYRTVNPSGENQVVDRETALLRGAGHEVVRYERSSDEIAGFSPMGRVMLPVRITWSGPERRRLSRLLAEVRPDVVHVHNTFPLLSASVLAAGWGQGIPVVLTLHNFRLACANGMLSRDGRPCRQCVGRLPLPAVRHGCYRDSPVRTLPVAAMIATHRSLGTWHRLVDRFVVPSESSRNVLVANGLPRAQVTVKPHFVDDPGIVRDGAGQDVLYLGRLFPEKGLDLLMAAWERKTAPGRLLIVGDGPLRQPVQRWAERTPGVRYLGRQERRRCIELLSQVRCVVVPSVGDESFGLVTIEAFASGVAVIGCALGALPELVEDGRTGWLTPPADAGALADRMDRVLVDPALASRMGAQARRRYEERYSPQVNLALLERLYHEVTAAVPA
jgi:glycosyltransferase involved in cell wall biosynthesis